VNRLFVDTSAWLGFLSARDRHHRAVKAIVATFDGRLVSSNFVLDEVLTLCKARLGHAAAVQLGGALRDASLVTILRVNAEDEETAWKLFVTRDDQPYSFTDCTSFVLMRRLGLRDALALDDDFRREGFQVVP
jgi:predicted nucleic acid-binding protein